MNNKLKKEILAMQQDEINSTAIYSMLAGMQKSDENRKILMRISSDEKSHYAQLKTITGQELKPRRLTVLFYTLMARTLGLTFTLKLMEKGESVAEEAYAEIGKKEPETENILRDEERHENELIDMINEESLDYMGSVVLGLNDALVELTGALAGFTFAIQNSRMIALLGLITGISASFSMAASEFLSQREENNVNAAKSSLYTGIAYVVTVILLITPFFIFSNPFVNLLITMSVAILIILVFNYYISVVRDLPFRRRFLEMLFISMGVALLSFGIGWFVRTFLGLDV